MKKKHVSRARTWVIIAAVGCLLTLLLTRLVDIQLLHGATYAQQSDDNRYYTVRIPAQRGIFLDRYGEPLVKNKRTYARRLDTSALHSQQQPLTEAEALPLLASDSAAVQFGLERQYQVPVALSHVLGYVGAVTADDLLNDHSLAVNDLVGKSGLERQFDQQLRGQSGKEVYEINALGQRQRLIEKKDEVAGQTLTTSLDPYLSKVAWQAMGDNIGAVIIEDASTGEILSMVSKPSFDANVLSTSYIDPLLEQQRHEQLKQLLADDKKPFFNRAIGGAYPPGSVFKLVTATGGLENKAIDATTTVDDQGTLKVGTYEYANWYFTQYGRTEGVISVRRALARSNDIFFYKVAEWLGPDRLAEAARLFGLGIPTGVDLPQEAAGTIPDPAWKEKVIGEPWFLGDTYHMGIGQGDVLVTPVQIAQLTQALANHGSLCRPTIVKGIAQATCRELSISDDHLQLVLGGMLDVCSSGGTAFPFFPYNAQFRAEGDQSPDPGDLINRGAIACKTGTAEFGAADRGHKRTHGWFASMMGTQPITKLADAVASGDQATIDGIKQRFAKTNSDPKAADEYLQWLRLVHDHGFPSRLVMISLVESDDAIPYKEGSQHAAPVIKTVVNWMEDNF